MANPGQATDGESELERLYRAHHDFVWRNARRLGCDDGSIDDVVHEVFLIVARKFGDFEGRSEIRTWLFAITYQVIRQLVRDRGRRGRRLEVYQTTRSLESARDPREVRDDSVLLQQLLGRLPEPKRLVFIMAELEGMTSVEIGRCLGMKTGTVDSRLRAARSELRAMLECEPMPHGRNSQ